MGRLMVSRSDDQPGMRSDFITADELAAAMHRADPPLVVDVRFTLKDGPLEGEYLAGHLPGAIYVDLERELSGPRTPGVGSYPLPAVDELTQSARSWGMDPDTEVVVYGGYTGLSAGRLAWLLRWVGHRRVRILDGGLRSWEQRKYPLVTGRQAPSRIGSFVQGEFTVPVAGVERVLELGEQRQLVDVRARSHYQLRAPDPSRGGRPPGRIPGAVNIPSPSLHRRNGQIRDPEEISTLLTSEGVSPDRPVAVYCGGGVASAWAAYALRSVGVDAELFAVSWSEYIADPGLPVEIEP